MTIIGIIFGGSSSEHRESIRATRLLYKNISSLFDKYEFDFFYLTQKNQWANKKVSESMVKGKLPIDYKFTKHFHQRYCDSSRILELKNVDVIYNTMMGDCGENGNIMGFADLVKVPMIGCGILASALCQNKYLAKILAEAMGISIVDYIYLDINNDNIKNVIFDVKHKIGYPCFVKPDNLGTCSFVFKANNETELANKLLSTLKENFRSDKYLIEKYIDNTEVRVFVYQDKNDEIQYNDQYVTKLNMAKFDGDDVSLFKHVKNNFSSHIRKKISSDALRIFKVFGMKDYARIDFFVENNTNKIYFNEANTQPFIGGYNIELMKKDKMSYSDFFEMMIKRNIK